ncbi:HTH-type transcriptional activator Btr [compost metagenome]
MKQRWKIIADHWYVIPEYISKIRIQNAKVLLQETDLNIQEISASVGITDSLYFSKLFKNVTGISPCPTRNTTTGAEP